MAVEHFLQAGFDNEVLKALEKAGRHTLTKGRWYTVSRWLKQLTEAQTSSSSWLSYYQAVVEAYRDWDELDKTMECARKSTKNKEKLLNRVSTKAGEDQNKHTPFLFTVI